MRQTVLLGVVVIVAACAVLFLLPRAARDDPGAPIPVIELREDADARTPPALPADASGGDDGARDD